MPSRSRPPRVLRRIVAPSGLAMVVAGVVLMVGALVGGLAMLVVVEARSSNCIAAGGGQVPAYDVCFGCIEQEAYGCINDMRNNVSKNVPTGCHMNALTLKDLTPCCPTFRGDGAQTVRGSTAAYPDAFRCLVDIGCRSTTVYEDLLAECDQFCGSDSRACAPRDAGTRAQAGALALSLMTTVLMSYTVAMIS